eukprot:TRINITY_DN26111_c0_g1_i1.p1 TRINITY_DN26111_c0_g1~~TRINITY_DN26111_c0_g1_i1.p1  ORF type:complete len:138 (-),score=19.73 TRINITY_DN26111_c0_g1_i1:718-1131(-)
MWGHQVARMTGPELERVDAIFERLSSLSPSPSASPPKASVAATELALPPDPKSGASQPSAYTRPQLLERVAAVKLGQGTARVTEWMDLIECRLAEHELRFHQASPVLPGPLDNPANLSNFNCCGRRADSHPTNCTLQ